MQRTVKTTYENESLQQILISYREKANRIIMQMLQVLSRAYKKVDEAQYLDRIKSLKSKIP